MAPTPVEYSHGVLKSHNSPFFPDLRVNMGQYLIDKTEVIHKIVNSGWLGDVHLVLRPRLCGKSTLINMLKSFFSTPLPEDSDPHKLFGDLQVYKYEDVCTSHMGKYPVITCDFKILANKSWDGMLAKFRDMVTPLYQRWRNDLLPLESPFDNEYYESIYNGTASEAGLSSSLLQLSRFLQNKFKKRVIILIDEYDAPLNSAYEHDYVDEANEFFRDLLSSALKSNENLQYALLTGVLPAAKLGCLSGLNNIDIHALHTRKSIFRAQLMFTEAEIEELIKRSNSSLELDGLKARYGSYVAGGSDNPIQVYNPTSVLSALKYDHISNYWVATGEYPLLNKEFPYDGLAGAIETLLNGNEFTFELMTVTYIDSSMSSVEVALTLLYYTGYLTMTGDRQFKIPNMEVKADWCRWLARVLPSAPPRSNILRICVEGPVKTFEAKWPEFMKNTLHPKLVGKARNASSKKTPENIFHVFFLGIMHSLESEGWEVRAEARGGDGYIDISLVHSQKHQAVLIELKSSAKKDGTKKDAINALEQITHHEYRSGLRDVKTLREYGIGCHHLQSTVKGRFLVLRGGKWVEGEDPAKAPKGGRSAQSQVEQVKGSRCE